MKYHDGMVLRSLYLPANLDSEYRRVAFERNVTKAELMRLFLVFGLDFLKNRKRNYSGLADLKAELDDILRDTKYLVRYGYLEKTEGEPPFESISGMKIYDSEAEAQEFTITEMKKGYDWWHQIYSATKLILIDERGMVEK